MYLNLPLIAGTISSLIFVSGVLPMLLKAFRTKNLRSYSLTNLLLMNMGNLVHAVYVYSLPFGPIWLLHAFNLATTALMLFWYWRYELWPQQRFGRKTGNALWARRLSWFAQTRQAH
jgi:uncharacterized protein with PQ loop repeat